MNLSSFKCLPEQYSRVSEWRILGMLFQEKKNEQRKPEIKLKQRSEWTDGLNKLNIWRTAFQAEE